MLHLHPHLGSFFSLPRSRVTTTLGSPPSFLPSHHQRGWFNHYHDYENCNIMGAHVCECVQRGSSSAVLSASSWRFHSSFCLAPISPLRLNPSRLPRAQHRLLADCPSNNDPVLLFGHPPWLIPYKNHLSTFPQDWWPPSLMKREFVGLHCLPDPSINDSQDGQKWTWVPPPPCTHA